MPEIFRIIIVEPLFSPDTRLPIDNYSFDLDSVKSNESFKGINGRRDG
jgi:hypothetical protein